MNRILLPALLSALLHPLTLDAQVLGVPAPADLARSVVRIYAEARLPHPDGIAAPYFVGATGTGVVIARVEVAGRMEYLILTNHHVAHPGNYVRFDKGERVSVTDNLWTGPVAPERQSILLGGGEAAILEVVAGNATADMALLRTNGTNAELEVFPGRIGVPGGEISPGHPVFTSGFPSILDGKQAVHFGSILTGAIHELGIPHQDLVLDFPVHHGQSGSPVVAEHEGELWLVGLVHAVDQRNTFVVPFQLWEETLSQALAELGAASGGDDGP